LLGPPMASTVTVVGFRNVYLKITFWTLTPFSSNTVIVALYAVTAVHALPKAINADDERDGVAEKAGPSPSIKRLALATVRRSDFFTLMTPEMAIAGQSVDPGPSSVPSKAIGLTCSCSASSCPRSVIKAWRLNYNGHRPLHRSEIVPPRSSSATRSSRTNRPKLVGNGGVRSITVGFLNARTIVQGRDRESEQSVMGER
jgi:hypothetical protein